MAFTELEHALNRKSLDDLIAKRRPPESVRSQLDISYAFVGQTVDIFEIRPDWQDECATRRTPVARIRFVRTQGQWLLYWMRRDLKWHAYEPDPIHSTLASALKAVDQDAECGFFG